ncbi:D-alanyl-D-alanine carboxypeptidase family protein [Phenylobacterium sp.]|uniref:D-alanyl-D-alanine carboxypeptidase family protein n=1 Tax=Phenylobacterium sp. TaxID=1871053 RepID=UPI0035B37086
MRVRLKPSDVLKFLGALAAAAVLLVLLVVRVTTGKGPEPPVRPAPPPVVATAPPPAGPDCHSARGWDRAARLNAASLRTLQWAPFGRPERGWEIYLPMIQQTIGADCPPDTPGFAAAFAAWQGDARLFPNGVMSPEAFQHMKGAAQERRVFVRLASQGVCPRPANEARLTAARPGEGYAGKQVQLRQGAFAAYRAMVEAAKAESPEIAADPRNLTIFSAYRSPAYDAARCARDGNCNGVVRARCSPHRTGLAMDLYVGQAPGYGPDSTADPNRLYMTRTPTYRWLMANAHRFGFVNYPFEPWHWEWTGETP